MSFQNLYYKRTAATAKACYACNKPSTTVLATMHNTDFLFTCPVHLSDSGFATLVKDGGSVSAVVSKEEIEKVKSEWEEKQQAKAERNKEKNEEKSQEKEKEADIKPAKKPNDKDGDNGNPSKSPVVTTTAPTHEKYILHRQIFSMRQAEHSRQKQAIQVKELGPRLPSPPTGSV